LLFAPAAVALSAFARALTPTAVALAWPAAVVPAWAPAPSAVVAALLKVPPALLPLP